jgi:hypothetical protein
LGLPDHRRAATIAEWLGYLPVMIRAALLACLLALAAAARADAKQASFNVSITGTQTTRVASSDRCADASGSTGTQTGQLTETVDFRTTRPGRVVFKSAPHRAVKLRQSTGVLGAGTATRDSSLDELGITPGACTEVTPASGCGSRPFDTWRLSLASTGGTAVALRSGAVAGGDPFRTCQNPFDGFPKLVRRASARVNPKALFKRSKRSLKLAGVLDQTREFADGYTGAKGTAATSLRFTAVLTRR